MNAPFLLFALFLLFGWILPFVIGVIRMRRRQPFGLPLAIFGGVWFIGFVLFFIVMTSFVVSRGDPQQFNPDSFGGPLGEIEHEFDGSAGVVLHDIERNHEWVIRSAQKRILVPAGAYNHWTFSASASDGREWSITSIGRRENLIVRELPEPPAIIPPPLNATVSMKVRPDRTATASFIATDKDGNMMILQVPGKLGFEALDKSRKVVWSGTFAYG